MRRPTERNLAHPGVFSQGERMLFIAVGLTIALVASDLLELTRRKRSA
jgi:hypothetical protein